MARHRRCTQCQGIMFACLQRRHAVRSPATRPHQALTGECGGHLWIRRPDGGPSTVCAAGRSGLIPGCSACRKSIALDPSPAGPRPGGNRPWWRS